MCAYREGRERERGEGEREEEGNWGGGGGKILDLATYTSRKQISACWILTYIHQNWWPSMLNNTKYITSKSSLGEFGSHFQSNITIRFFLLYINQSIILQDLQLPMNNLYQPKKHPLHNFHSILTWRFQNEANSSIQSQDSKVHWMTGWFLFNWQDNIGLPCTSFIQSR